MTHQAPPADLPPKAHPQISDIRASGAASAQPAKPPPKPREIGGRNGPEPTRYGDWELRGRCIDF